MKQALLFGRQSGSEWNCFDETGTQVGIVRLEVTSASPFVNDGIKTAYTVPVSFSFNDGSTVRAEKVQFFDFPHPVSSPIDPSSCAPGEVNTSIVPSKGLASGVITSGTGLFANATSKTMDLRYVHQSIQHSDGTVTFCDNRFGSWYINY